MKHTNRVKEKLSSYLLNLAGEYRVCSELNKRGIFSTVTYGNLKGVDVYAIADKNGQALKIEVKTSQKNNFVTCITQKRLDNDLRTPDFWVLFQVKPLANSDFQDRFFILSHKEICLAQKQRNQIYAGKYKKRNKKTWDPMTGVDSVLIEDVEKYENQWSKIIDQFE